MFTDDPDLWQFIRFRKLPAARTMDGYEYLTIRGTIIDSIVDIGLTISTKKVSRRCTYDQKRLSDFLAVKHVLHESSSR